MNTKSTKTTTRQCVAEKLPEGWAMLPEAIAGPRIRLRSPTGAVRYVAGSRDEISCGDHTEHGNFSTPEKRADVILKVAGVLK